MGKSREELLALMSNGKKVPEKEPEVVEEYNPVRPDRLEVVKHQFPTTEDAFLPLILDQLRETNRLLMHIRNQALGAPLSKRIENIDGEENGKIT